MTEQYIGINAIAARLGVKSARAVMRAARFDGLPIRRAYNSKGKQRWLLDEDLYTKWRLERSEQDRRYLNKHDLYRRAGTPRQAPAPDTEVAEAEQVKTA